MRIMFTLTYIFRPFNHIALRSNSLNMMTESQFVDYVQSLNLKSPAPPNNEQNTPKAGPWYVVDNIYLGCLDNARNVGLMCTVGINAMLNCAAPHEYQPMYTKAMELYHHFQVKHSLNMEIMENWHNVI